MTRPSPTWTMTVEDVADPDALTGAWELEARAYGYEPKDRPTIETSGTPVLGVSATVTGPVRCVDHRKHRGGIVQAAAEGPGA